MATEAPKQPITMNLGGILDKGTDETVNIPSPRGTKRYMRIWSLLGMLFIVIFAAITKFREFKGADSPQCRPIYMYPAYALINGFDERYTSLAKKYHLYLYREQGQDKVPMNDNGDEILLDGVPVLFIPGNAGSFKQVRSIAAACSNIYFKELDTLGNRLDTQNLDFFAADFNEDFTAFHGRTMMDQAEYLNDAIRYILSLYEQAGDASTPKPESVIIVAHSMGGMVARIIPGLQNYIYGSINTIITLSTPHGAAPVTFDGDILKIYQKTNSYWIQQFQDDSSFFSKNISLISITGGILDDVLPADYVFVKDFLPEKNGFSTFTSTIPGVWTPIDHLAIVWCNQLRNVIAKLLLEIVDRKVPHKTKPLEERVSIARELLLSGYESNITTATTETALREYNINEYSKFKKWDPNQDTSLNGEQIQESAGSLLLDISSINTFDQFNLLTNIDHIDINLCNEKTKTQNDAMVKYMICENANSFITKAPTDVVDPDSEDINKEFKIINMLQKLLIGKSHILIQYSNDSDITVNDFVNIRFHTVESTPQHVVKHSPYYLSFFSSTFTIKSTTWIYYENLWDSIISYKLNARLISSNQERLQFQPFIRQWINNQYETKWHNNILNEEVDISMHNIGPFIPTEKKKHGLNLMLYVPKNAEMKISLKINWLLTFKLLFIRFRLAIGSFPIFIISSVLAYQFYWYNKSSIFVDFKVALARVLIKYGLLLLIAMFALSFFCNSTIGQQIFYRLDPIKINKPIINGVTEMDTNNYFLGLRSAFVSWVAVLLMIMSFGLVSFLYEVLAGIETIIRYLRNSIAKKAPGSKNMINTVIFDRRRVLTSLSLLLLVTLYIPYQLAFSIVLVVQLATCIKICITVPKSSVEYNNLRNYNLSMLILFIFVFIINAPVVIIFLHNVAIRWETPFKSHHNVLAIAPIIFLASANSTLNMPHFDSNKLIDGGLTVAITIYLGVFSIIYGIRNMYWIHHIVNVLCGWLLFGFMNKKKDSLY